MGRLPDQGVVFSGRGVRHFSDVRSCLWGAIHPLPIYGHLGPHPRALAQRVIPGGDIAGSGGTDINYFRPCGQSTLQTAPLVDWPPLQPQFYLSPRGALPVPRVLSPGVPRGSPVSPRAGGPAPLHPAWAHPALWWPRTAAPTGTPSSAELGPHLQGSLRSGEGSGALGPLPRSASVIRPPRRWNYTLTLTRAGTSQRASNVVSDILRIDSLWQFENLRKLQLDNNVIEKIEGLENLTHLVWLGEAPARPPARGDASRGCPQVNFPASPGAAPVQQELHLLGLRWAKLSTYVLGHRRAERLPQLSDLPVREGSWQQPGLRLGTLDSG